MGLEVLFGLGAVTRKGTHGVMSFERATGFGGVVRGWGSYRGDTSGAWGLGSCGKRIRGCLGEGEWEAFWGRMGVLEGHYLWGRIVWGVGLCLGTTGEQHKGLREGTGGRLCLVGWGAGEEMTVFQGESPVPPPPGARSCPGSRKLGKPKAPGAAYFPRPRGPAGGVTATEPS